MNVATIFLTKENKWPLKEHNAADIKTSLDHDSMLEYIIYIVVHERWKDGTNKVSLTHDARISAKISQRGTTFF